MSHHSHVYVSSLLLVLCFITGQSCAKNDFIFEANATQTRDTSNVICDPFGASGGNSRQGFAGKLYYFPKSMSRNDLMAQDAYAYVQKGIDTGFQVILRSLNIAPRSFTDGFIMSDGRVLKDNDGNVLTEFFGMDLRGFIKLGPNDPEGLYRLGIISDDGSRVEVLKNGVYDTVINNDGVHEYIFTAASTNIAFTKDTLLPIRIIYFQGPGDKLGMQMQWRRDDIPDENFRIMTNENLVLPDDVVGCS